MNDNDRVERLMKFLNALSKFTPDELQLFLELASKDENPYETDSNYINPKRFANLFTNIFEEERNANSDED